LPHRQAAEAITERALKVKERLLNGCAHSAVDALAVLNVRPSSNRTRRES
jgi:hypothetical protein